MAPVGGDRNTAYFHHKAGQRRARNRVEKLIMSNGQVITEIKDLKRAVVSYFTDLFSAEGQRDLSMEDLPFRTLDATQKDFLCSALTIEEVEFVVRHLPNTKALGSDSIHGVFLKKGW